MNFKKETYLMWGVVLVCLIMGVVGTIIVKYFAP